MACCLDKLKVDGDKDGKIVPLRECLGAGTHKVSGAGLSQKDNKIALLQCSGREKASNLKLGLRGVPSKDFRGVRYFA